MKIAILSFYSGHVERGVEVWVESLKKSLEGKCDVNILGSKSRLNLKKEVDKNSISRNFFVDYWSLSIAKFTLQSISELYKLNPDIIIPTNGGWQSLITRIYTFLLGKKMIVIGHSGIGRDDRWNLFMFPDHFVALSSEAKRWACKVNPYVKSSYIPNGIFLDEFKKALKAKVNLPFPRYLFVGSIEKSKRPSLVIEAVSRIKGSLLMLGDGPDRKEVLELGQNILGGRFKLISVKHSEIPKYYKACDVFTLPAWNREAFGIVYLEAMASGLPVVTTDDPIKREIVGNAGIFVDPTDVEGYAKALEMASQKKWKEIPVKQASKFSWNFVGEKYLELFNTFVK